MKFQSEFVFLVLFVSVSDVMTRGGRTRLNFMAELILDILQDRKLFSYSYDWPQP